jgi:Rrf2 family protein
MKVSTKGEYGVRALLELTKHYGEGYILSSDIAAARGIPENYLYQLLITLRKAGIIRSRRGPQGGHMLARAPEDISVADAILALEGPIEPTLCVQDEIVNDCPYNEGCAMREVWQAVTDVTREVLQNTRLSALAEREAQIRRVASTAD